MTNIRISSRGRGGKATMTKNMLKKGRQFYGSKKKKNGMWEKRKRERPKVSKEKSSH